MKMLVFMFVLVFSCWSLAMATTVQTVLATGEILTCDGIVGQAPKTYNITMTTFKQNSAFYADEAAKGNAVKIIGYNKRNFQLIKI